MNLDREESIVALEQPAVALVAEEREGLLVVVDGAPPLVVAAVDESMVVELDDAPLVAEVDERPTLIVAGGDQGPPGAPGASGMQEKAYIAGENLSGERAVYVDADGNVQYADHADLGHLYQIAGITTQAGLAGSSVNVRGIGPHTFPGWSWTPDLPIFLGSNGNLTQTPPATGALVVLGAATSPTSMFIRVGRPVRRQ